MAKTPPTPAPAAPAFLPPSLSRYWRDTRRPIANLIFLLPIIAVYEAGSLWLRDSIEFEQRLVAQRLLLEALDWFGGGGFWAPGVALVMILLAWQVLSRESWRIDAKTPALMLVESLALTLPLFVLNGLLLQAGAESADLRPTLIAAIGAAVYEELVFRMILISALMFLLVDLLGLQRKAAIGVSVAVGGVVFAACHYVPIGGLSFSWSSFGQHLIAGLYLSLLFLTRGLGISTGCHAGYNLMLIWSQWTGIGA